MLAWYDFRMRRFSSLLALATVLVTAVTAPAFAAVPKEDVPRFRQALGLHAGALRTLVAKEPSLTASDRKLAKHLADFYTALHEGVAVNKLGRADLEKARVHLLKAKSYQVRRTNPTLVELMRAANVAWGKLEMDIK